MVDCYPFSAVVGQTLLKRALILNAIDSSIGGVLVSGPRGSAKTTLARGVAQLLPDGASLVTLPLAATEEMIVGTMDLQRVLDEQRVAFSPGLLAKAHNGVLYVDEVNLLNDTLVDLLLDVAASGINHVERDGISHSHDTRFVLIGTMNPDEGELRPQLQDRFGLAVELNDHYSVDDRVTIVRRREQFDRDPVAFVQNYQVQQQKLASEIEQARDLLVNVGLSDEHRRQIAIRCQQANVDGMRADIVWARAAMAHAALQQRIQVSADDIDAVAELVLLHRRNAESDNVPPQPPRFNRPPSGGSTENGEEPSGDVGEWGSLLPESQSISKQHVRIPAAGSIVESKQIPVQQSGLVSSERKKGQASGGVFSSRINSTRPSWFATLVANLGQWPPKTIRFGKQRRSSVSLHFILLDTSASTLKAGQFGLAKAAILAVSQQAYLARQQLAIWGFGNDSVKTLLPKVRAPKQLYAFLESLKAAGGTPLNQALSQAATYLNRLQHQHPDLQIATYLITDGRSSQNAENLKLPGKSMLIDIESSAIKRGRGEVLAQQLNAQYYPLTKEAML